MYLNEEYELTFQLNLMCEVINWKELGIRMLLVTDLVKNFSVFCGNILLVPQSLEISGWNLIYYIVYWK